VSEPAIPEELITFVQVLQEDGDLRAWFESFAEMPEWQRADEFRRLAARMQSGGEHPDLIRATALLAEPQVYAAVSAIIANDGEVP
jgi:hypothetical protein